MDYRYNLVYKRLLEAEKKGTATPQAMSILQTLTGLIIASEYTGPGLYGDSDIKEISEMISGSKDFSEFVSKMKGLLDKVTSLDKKIAKNKGIYEKIIDKAAAEASVSFKDSTSFESLKKQLLNVFAVSSTAIKKKAQNISTAKEIKTELKESVSFINEAISPSEAAKMWLVTQNMWNGVDSAMREFEAVYPDKSKDSRFTSLKPKLEDLKKRLDALDIKSVSGPLSLGKIKTQGEEGKMKRKKYAFEIEKLQNDIFTFKKEVESARLFLTQYQEIPPIPMPKPVVIKDDTKKESGTDKGGSKKGGKGTAGREFDIKALQAHMASLADCIKTHLGTIDGIWGPKTSKAANLLYSVKNKEKISSNEGITKEKYDTIMSIDKAFMDSIIKVDTDGLVKEGLKFKSSFREILEKKEILKSVSVLNWNDFDSSFKKASEKKSYLNEAIAIKVVDFICKSLKQNTSILKPDSTSPSDSSTLEKKTPDSTWWEGLKFSNDNTYPISFDESLLSFWSKEILTQLVFLALPGSGQILKAGSMEIKALAAGAKVTSASMAEKALAEAGIEKIINRSGVEKFREIATKKFISKEAAEEIIQAASKASAKEITQETASKMSFKAAAKEYFAKFGKYPVLTLTPGRLVGGGFAAAALDFFTGRNSFSFNIYSGFIERSAVLAMARGLIDTIDGFVSDDDMACIAQILSLVKGTWTITSEGKAASAWDELKKEYQKIDGESLVDDINSIGTGTKFGDIEGFPSNLRSVVPFKNPVNMPIDQGMEEIKDFVKILDSNEGALQKNISKIDPNIIKCFSEGNIDFVTPEEFGKKVFSEDGSEKEKKQSKEDEAETK